MRLVASDVFSIFQYETTPDNRNFIERGNRYRTASERVWRGRMTERTKIEPASPIACRVRIDMVYADRASVIARGPGRDPMN